jgi:hypothetical protein
MGLKVTNNAFGTLNAGITSSSTTIVLQAGEGARFPTLSAGDYFYATLIDTTNNLEIVKVTARSTDTMTVVRAQDNTTARAFSTNDRFELRPTAALFNEVVVKAEGSVQKTSDTGAALMPVGTTAERPASPAAGMYRLNTTTTEPEWYDTVASAWVAFRSEPVRAFSADFLVVAGGGGGGGGSAGSGGGGGAGGYRSFTSQAVIPSTNYTVTVGAGGSAGASNTQGGKGSDSIFSSFTSTGGGLGGYNTAGGTGGSGGGSGNDGAGLSTFTGAAGNTPSTSPSQGNNGGANFASLSAWTGGGGGGASAVGGSGSSGVAGSGGAGTASSITGSSVTRAGGGGGGSWNAGTSGGTGGAGGGGAGGKGAGSAGTQGTVNTGGGGGGGGQDSAGAAGGSGVVIIKYPDTFTITNPGGGLTFTTASSGGFKVTTFTAGTGSIQFN